VRKTVGAIVGFAILLGLLFAVALYIWPAPANTNLAESQALAELQHRLTTVDDLQQRGILSREIAKAQRQHYSVQAQASLSESHFHSLVEIKYKMDTVDDLYERAILSKKETQTEKQRYLVEAQTIVGEALGPDQLLILLEHLDSGKFIEAQQATQNSKRLSIPMAVWVLLGLTLVTLAGWLLQPYLSSIRERAFFRPQPSPHTLEAEPGHNGQQSDTKQPAPSYAALSFESSDPQPTSAEPLTRREIEVLALVAKGLTNREIAQRLIITPGTAKVHISNIYGKLSVNRRVQAVAKAQELGILSSEQ
jgi:ATP/maltotriose-dependent transcriptional regulator MalT